MPVPRPLPEPLVELVARRFRLIGEPMRIRLLDQLRDQDRSVGELTDALGASQQNVSKHMALLHRADAVQPVLGAGQPNAQASAEAGHHPPGSGGILHQQQLQRFVLDRHLLLRPV